MEVRRKEQGPGVHHIDSRCVCGLTQESEGVNKTDEDKKKKKNKAKKRHFPWDFE